MFFDNSEIVLKKNARLHAPPPIPDNGWRVPAFPNLAGNCSLISFDVETKDPRLQELGPGWARHDGHIVGLAVAARDRLGNRGKWYFPMRHEIEGHLNLDPRNVLAWASEVLGDQTEKVGANLTYDIGWLKEEDVDVRGPLHDIQFAEALIDSDSLVALEHLSRKYLGKGKTTEAMYAWMRQAYPNTPETYRRRDIYRTPPQLVGYYGEDDAGDPIDIMDRQRPILLQEALWNVYRLECDLIPLMVAMRFEGVCVDLGHTYTILERMEQSIKDDYKRLSYEYGFPIESSASTQIYKLFDHVGIEYPRTDTGKPQIRKEWLTALEHPLGEQINTLREHEKLCGTFLRGYILDKSIPFPGSNSHGLIFPVFHQLANDENGTFVGRFASSDPNLQNIPSRSDEGKLIREAFTHNPGHVKWVKFDFSQIHYRLLAHFAVDNGDGSAERLRDSYRNDRKMDYHMKVYQNVAPLIGWSTTDEKEIKKRRRPIKNVNFSLIYGVSNKTIRYKYLPDMSDDEVTAFMKAYYEGAPYVKPTMQAIGREVQANGFVTTVAGRRVRFNLFEPAGRREKGEYYEPLPYQQALRRYGSPLKYAYEYRGVNYKFQGSEPDIMKSGMLACWKSGVFDFTGVPRVTVHDELGFSRRDDSKETAEAFDFIQHTLETTIPLRVPVFVDRHDGPNWGQAD